MCAQTTLTKTSLSAVHTFHPLGIKISIKHKIMQIHITRQYAKSTSILCVSMIYYLKNSFKKRNLKKNTTIHKI